MCSRTTVRAWLTSAAIQESSVESGFAIPGSGELEPRHRAFQSVGERREARSRNGSLFRAVTRELRDGENRLHVGGDLRRRARLLARGGRDRADEAREAV